MFESALLGFIGPLAAGILTAVVSVRLALRRFRNERWWERRMEAYSRLFGALFDVQRSLQQEVKRIEEHIEVTEEYRKDINDRATTGYADIRRAAALGTFLFGPAVVRRLETLVAVLDSSRYNVDIYEDIVEDLDAITAALRDLKDLAKRDLALK